MNRYDLKITLKIRNKWRLRNVSCCNSAFLPQVWMSVTNHGIYKMLLSHPYLQLLLSLSLLYILFAPVLLCAGWTLDHSPLIEVTDLHANKRLWVKMVRFIITVICLLLHSERSSVTWFTVYKHKHFVAENKQIECRQYGQNCNHSISDASKKQYLLKYSK